MTSPRSMAELVALLREHGFEPAAGGHYREGCYVFRLTEDTATVSGCEQVALSFGQAWAEVCRRFGIEDRGERRAPSALAAMSIEEKR
jgi:hypothetical protein